MDKGDLQFIAGTVVSFIFGILGLLGLDWKIVQGRIPMLKATNFARKDWFFVIGILGSLAFSRWGLHARSSSFVFDPNAKFIVVYDKTFRNEMVPLDGFDYENCTFINVKLKYNATTSIRLRGIRAEGIYIISDNPSVGLTGALLKGLGFLKEDVPILGSDEKPLPGISSPVGPPQPTQQ